MHISEMIWVLEHERECLNKSIDGCDKECNKCSLSISNSTKFKTYDALINLLDDLSRKSTRQNF